ncbi:MAG: HAD-IB family phosphatase [Thermoplasmatales archaeon]|nr:MAG: HAD-IB family phosphatase [Thermoplasmatales archaeon]
MTKYKLAIFDMDGTLIKDRTIFVLAEKKGFTEELNRVIKSDMEFYKKSIDIARSLKGMNINELLEIVRNIPLQENVEEIIRELKKRGIKTAIATDSYQFFAEDLKERLGIDYAFANNLIIYNNIVTGDLEIHNKELKKDFISNKIYSICKSCVLEQLCENLNISENEAIAVGDSKVDIGMIKRAGLGIAFNASEEVQKHADVSTEAMVKILDYI